MWCSYSVKPMSDTLVLLSENSGLLLHAIVVRVSFLLAMRQEFEDVESK